MTVLLSYFFDKVSVVLISVLFLNCAGSPFSRLFGRRNSCRCAAWSWYPPPVHRHNLVRGNLDVTEIRDPLLTHISIASFLGT